MAILFSSLEKPIADIIQAAPENNGFDFDGSSSLQERLLNVRNIKEPHNQKPVFFKRLPERLKAIYTLERSYFPHMESDEAYCITGGNDFAHWISKSYFFIPGTEEYVIHAIKLSKSKQS